MARRKKHRIINALALAVGGVFFCLLVGTTTLMVWPGLAFSHQAGDERVMFHGVEPMSQEAATRAGAEAWAAMQNTALGQSDHQINVYVTGGSGWRHWLFFRPAPWAGGLTYPILSPRAIFLRDVDLEAGRLVGIDGPIPDPRNLTYYLVHEMTHLRHGEVVGSLAFLRTPAWVREGIPEIAALGLAEDALMTAAMAGAPLPREVFGSYPIERACVSMMLASGAIEIAEVLDMRAPMHAPETCFTLPRPDSD